MRRRPRLGVRARITVGFSLLALLVSVGLALISYTLARRQLIENQDRSSVGSALVAAGAVARELQATTPDPQGLLNGALRPTDGNGFVSIQQGAATFSSGGGPGSLADLPPQVSNGVMQGRSFRVRTKLNVGDDAYLITVVQLKDLPQSTFIQAIPLRDLSRNLTLLATSLAIGATIATLGGAGIGSWASRRVLRPLVRVADAASELARSAETILPSATEATARLDESDRELQRLAASFNDMVDAIHNRIAREQRFASDVSHELRTPLQAMLTSIDVLENRKQELPERSQQALTALSNQTRRFDRMVRDLLEISRLDAGVSDVYAEPVQLDQFVVRVAGRYDCANVPIIVSPAWRNSAVLADRRRLEQVLANLFVNARNHGDGPTRVTIDGARSPSGRPVARVGVEDAGPGVPPVDRLRIFERFARGAAARQRAPTAPPARARAVPALDSPWFKNTPNSWAGGCGSKIAPMVNRALGSWSSCRWMSRNDDS